MKSIEITGTCLRCGDRSILTRNGWECGSCFCNQTEEDELAVEDCCIVLERVECETPEYVPQIML
jgi:hypothetical protein